MCVWGRTVEEQNKKILSFFRMKISVWKYTDKKVMFEFSLKKAERKIKIIQLRKKNIGE